MESETNHEELNTELRETANEPETAVKEQDTRPEAAPGAEEKAEKRSGNTARYVLAAAAFCLLAAIIVSVIIISGKKSGSTQEAASAQSAAETVEETAAETAEATVPEDGDPDDVTCKGSYTGEDEELAAAMDTVVATAGSNELTNGELQVYYWTQVYTFLNNYGSYLSYFGLDYTQPLDTQVCPMSEEGLTWQQYFLDIALENWQSLGAMAAEAEKNGTQMEESMAAELETLQDNMQETAEQNGMETVDELIRAELGAGGTFENYEKYLSDYFSGYSYYNEVMDAFEAGEEEIENYFAENEESYAEDGLTRDTVYVNVRHILITPEDVEDSSDEDAVAAAKAAAEEKAQAVLDEWLKGSRTEERFAELANTYSDDPGSNTNGGLYEDVYSGEMVQAFNDWCFDPERAVGDYGIVETDYGYHVMYFSGSRTIWQEEVLEDLRSEAAQELIDSVLEKYPLAVDYASILLGEAKFE